MTEENAEESIHPHTNTNKAANALIINCNKVPVYVCMCMCGCGCVCLCLSGCLACVATVDTLSALPVNSSHEYAV